jgi:Xaa-Pro dipeptidase
MNKEITPAQEINSRITGIQKKIKESGIDGLFIVQRMDLYYFSGTAQNGYLYIPAIGNPILIIKKYLPRAKEETSIKNVIGIDSVKEVPGRIFDFYGRLPEVMGFELDVMPVNDFTYFQTLFKAREYRDASGLIHSVRMIKSAWEIEQIEKVTELSYKTFKFINKELRPGLSEIEFAGMYETYSRKLGHQAGLRNRNYLAELYNWHILSGKSGGTLGLLDSPASGEGTSPSFPAGAGRKKIRKNEPVMIDIGFVYNGYHIDETRMFAIEKMPQKALSACEVSIEIHDSVLEKARPGVSIGELFNHAVTKAKSLGYEDSFLGPPGYKVTFIGHGIGLELVEPPILARNRDDQLIPGMVFALEPKLVFENEFSAGIESMIMITETGSRILSKVPVKVFIKK